MDPVNWHEDYWFDKYYAGTITDEFKTWWLGFYGRPDIYKDKPDEIESYWVRCAFAWNGWNARKAEE